MNRSAQLTAVLTGACLSATAVAAEMRVGQRDPLDAQPMRALPLAPEQAQAGAANAFNPALSVILDGAYYSDNRRGELPAPAGFGHDHDHDHGALDQGFNLRESELVFSAAVDNYLDAVLILAIDSGHGLEVEEAYASTRSLPAGLQLRFGRFLSDIGYINKQHPHDWDFSDRPLVNELFFGDHGLRDTGVQLSWVPATPFYTRFGLEVMQGESEALVGDSEASGPRLLTGFAKVSPDLGYDHALQVGLFGGFTDAWRSVEAHGDHAHTYAGDTWILGTDWVYRYDAGRAFGQGDWRLQAEYAYRQREYEELGHAGGLSDRQDGLYAQAVYGFAPRWSAGARYDVLGLSNRVRGESLDASHRYAANVTFNATEFSRFRLQVNHGRYGADDHGAGHGHEHAEFTQVYLQYILSLGVHGAHAF